MSRLSLINLIAIKGNDTGANKNKNTASEVTFPSKNKITILSNIPIAVYEIITYNIKIYI
jgi:hypothetical protein